MSNIILIMFRKAIVQGLIDRLNTNKDINLIYEPNYDKANISICAHHADLVIIEAEEKGPFDMEFCLKLCHQLRSDIPKCKLLLMCSEHDDSSVKKVVDAKWSKQIDDFVFYDVTSDYLASKLISMQ